MRRHYKEMVAVVGEIKLQAAKEEQFRNHTADRYRRYALTRLSMRALKDHVRESKLKEQAQLTMCQYRCRLKYLYYTAFIRWYQALPALKSERLELHQSHDALVHRFRLRLIGRKVLKALKVHSEQERTLREKEDFKNMMRGKVSTWLKEITTKEDNFETIIPQP